MMSAGKQFYFDKEIIIAFTQDFVTKRSFFTADAGFVIRKGFVDICFCFYPMNKLSVLRYFA